MGISDSDSLEEQQTNISRFLGVAVVSRASDEGAQQKVAPGRTDRKDQLLGIVEGRQVLFGIVWMEWYVVGKWEVREVFQLDMPLSDSAYAKLNINISAVTLNLSLPDFPPTHPLHFEHLLQLLKEKDFTVYLSSYRQ